MEKKGNGVWLIVIGIIVILVMFGACSDDDYSETLSDGLDKFYRDEPMTKQEHDAVENYYEWLDDQRMKKYDDWK